MKVKRIATVYAILAAALYAVNVPFSKLLLNHADPTMMASFLYLGAGIGLFLYGVLEKATGRRMITLTGATLDEVLYFVFRGAPVYAM